jgi:hypothetical protein
MRKDNEALAQREKPVETEAVEIEGFVLDFEGTIENAKNVARYAKGVVGATGVIPALLQHNHHHQNNHKYHHRKAYLKTPYRHIFLLLPPFLP